MIRTSYEKARRASTTKDHDYVNAYVASLGAVVDLERVSAAGLELAVDPLGGAGVHYWSAIAERYKLNLTVTNDLVDPTFRFMDVDWDGRIRMDPSSAYAMRSLIALKDRYDVAFACDTDHDRHGVVTKSVGLLPPNHYLAACVQYLFSNRPSWPASTAIGKTVVSSSVIDRVAAKLNHPVYEVPVGFKWFVDGLLAGRLGFVGEESAGSTFLRRDGSVWTTDKDGIVAALAGGGDDGKDRPRPRRDLCGAGARVRRLVLRAGGRARDARTESRLLEAVARGDPAASWPASRSGRC